MLLQLAVKQPESLDAAKEEFLTWAVAKRYTVESIAVYEQPTFFDEKTDAVIYAVVRRKKHADVSSEGKAPDEPAVGLHLQEAQHQNGV